MITLVLFAVLTVGISGDYWCTYPRKYIKTYAATKNRYLTLDHAKAACLSNSQCTGVTFESGRSDQVNKYTVRSSTSLSSSTSDEISFKPCNPSSTEQLWCPYARTFIKQYPASGTYRFTYLPNAQTACLSSSVCTGITFETGKSGDKYTLRTASTLRDSTSDEVSWKPCEGPCRLTRIEILSSAKQKTYLGTKIIGISSAGSCVGSGISVLTLAHTSTIEESIGIELSEESGIDWSVSTSVEVSAGFEIFGASAKVTVGLEVGVGGSKSFGKTETSSSSSSSGTEIGHQSYYDAPGAALTLGSVEKYSTNMDAVPVLEHFLCNSGKTYTKNSFIKLRQTHYEAAHFEDLRGTFTAQSCAANSYNLADCVSRVKSAYNGFLGDVGSLRHDFIACFADGKGTISKMERVKAKLKRM